MDFNTPSIARVYDAMLDGKDNYAWDRAVADEMRRAHPTIPDAAVENRSVLARLVQDMVRRGITQFIDLGSGLPTARNTHEAAHEIDPTVHVVYVDNDPVVLAHGRALLARDGNTRVVTADFLRPDEVLAHPDVVELIDFTRPVGLLLVGILHHVGDQHQPDEKIRRYVDRLPAGSHVGITEWADTGLQVQRDIAEISRQALGEGRIRTPREFTDHFVSGLEILPPGVVYSPLWQPDKPLRESDLSDGAKLMLAGLAVKR